MKCTQYYHAIARCICIITRASGNAKGGEYRHGRKHAGILVLARVAPREDIALHRILWRTGVILRTYSENDLFSSFLVSPPGILGSTSDFHEEAAAGVSGDGLFRSR